MNMYEIIFYFFAVVTVASAAVVVFSRNIVYSAFALLFTFFGVAGIYVLLNADFLAITQLLIYVGGILVLLLFGVMLTTNTVNIDIKSGSVNIFSAVSVVAILAGVLGSVADELRELGVRGASSCRWPSAASSSPSSARCRSATTTRDAAQFDPVTTPRTKWAPSRDHYPILKSAGGKLAPENVRLSHTGCNNGTTWRTQIGTLLAKGKSLAEIAETLNRKGVPPAHGTNRWTAAMVRKAYVS